MIKVVIDGNPSDGWNASINIPSNLDVKDDNTHTKGGLHVTNIENKLEDVIPNLVDEVKDTYGFNLLEQEFVVVHENSSLATIGLMGSQNTYDKLDKLDNFNIKEAE